MESHGKGKQSRKGYGKKSNNWQGRGQGKGYGKDRPKGNSSRQDEEWDAEQKSNRGQSHGPLDLARCRPQRPVEVFSHLTVSADWSGRKEPRSGSAFFLPLIWTALLLEDVLEDQASDRSKPSSACIQLETLGTAEHFHAGSTRRSTVFDVRAAQVFWRQVFSGWTDWARRLRAAIDAYEPPGGRGPRGRDGIVAARVQRLTMTACALIFGDLGALGGLPHISNAQKSPDQDVIMDLDLMLRLEVEASVRTLYLPAAPDQILQPGSLNTSAASGAAEVLTPAPDGRQAAEKEEPAAIGSAEAGMPAAVASTGDVSMTGPSDVDKEIMKLKKKLREIEKLKQMPIDQLEVLQRKKLEGEGEILERLSALGAAP